MFAERKPEQQSPLLRQLKMIADLAHYQPVPSIPNPSQGFNYTLSQQRYSEFQTPRPIKKQKAASWAKSEDLKLSTILETQNYNHLFPRINRPTHKQSPQRRAKLPTHFHKERQETEATRERSLTHDTPMTNEEERFISLESQRDNEQSLSFSRRQPLNSQKKLLRYQKKQEVQAEASLEEEAESSGQEFEKDAVPGPGTYSYSYSDFDRKSMGKKSTKASFNSHSTRFPEIKPNLVSEPEPNNFLLVEREKKREERIMAKKSRRKFVPFNSKSPKKHEAEDALKMMSPGPEDYSPRLGIEEELIRKIQRNFRSNFGSNQQRFKPLKDASLHLGPGCYEPAASGPTLEGQNFYFKSQLQRF